MTKAATRRCVFTAPFLLIALAPGLQAQRTINEPDNPLLRGFRWRAIGPLGQGGRVDDIAVDERDPSTFYIGFAVSGILKTTNNELGGAQSLAVGSVQHSDPHANAARRLPERVNHERVQLPGWWPLGGAGIVPREGGRRRQGNRQPGLPRAGGHLAERTVASLSPLKPSPDSP